MIYNATNDFIRLSETSGTIQNNSFIFDVEISDKPVPNSGIFLHPLNKCSFCDSVLFVRCVAGSSAELRVVPFTLDACAVAYGGDSSPSASFTNDDVQDIFNP